VNIETVHKQWESPPPIQEWVGGYWKFYYLSPWNIKCIDRNMMSQQLIPNVSVSEHYKNIWQLVYFRCQHTSPHSVLRYLPRSNMFEPTVLIRLLKRCVRFTTKGPWTSYQLVIENVYRTSWSVKKLITHMTVERVPRKTSQWEKLVTHVNV
jgi:hypothetical protein